MADLILPDLPPGSSVAVAMSGGVDSSVAAALLVEAGHRVVGIMLRLWSEPGADSANKCCTLGAIDDAQAVADHLGIPFSVLDAREAFFEAVVAPFLQASQAGDTPNPCFGCNRTMRFGWLLERAQALGADYLATGHYARVARDPAGAYQLLRGLDSAKDQSYMLHRLDQRQLAAAVFPVGVYPKPEVRCLAERFGLSVAKRADSVDLCWTGAGGVVGFLGRHLPAEAMEAGPILHVDGHELGRHAGLPRYTIGQRRGLGIAGGVPLYVSGRDRQRNVLLMGEADALECSKLELTDMCWTAGEAPAGPCRVEAQIRYRAVAQPGELRPSADGRRATMCFDAPVRAASPGQGLVAYLGDAVLGGGRIRMEEVTEA